MDHQLDTFALEKTPENSQNAIYLESSTRALDVWTWGREKIKLVDQIWRKNTEITHDMS